MQKRLGICLVGLLLGATLLSAGLPLAGRAGAPQVAAAVAQPEEEIPNIRWEMALPLEPGQPVSQVVASVHNANWYHFALPRAGTWQLCFSSSVTQQAEGWIIEIYRATPDGREEEPFYATYFCPADDPVLKVPRVHETAGAYYISVGGRNPAPYSVWMDFTPDVTDDSSNGGNSNSDGSQSGSGGDNSASNSNSQSGGSSSSGTNPGGPGGDSSDDSSDDSGTPPGSHWETEPNDTAAQASGLAAGRRTQGTLFSYDDVDWYVLALEKPGVLALRFENAVLAASTQWQAWLYAEAGEGPAEAPVLKVAMDATQPAHDAEIGLPAGRYYLRVFGSGMPSLEYSLGYAFTPDESWEQEGNDYYEEADPMVLGTAYFGNSGAMEDNDWYTFSVAELGALYISFGAVDSAPPPEASWVLTLYGMAEETPEPQLLDSRVVAAGQPLAEEWLALAPGDYYLRVHPGDASVLKLGYRLELGLRAFAPVVEVRMAQTGVTLVRGSTLVVGTMADTEDGSDAPLAWESSDPAVAQVAADGTITALQAGTAAVTARAENGVFNRVQVQVVAKSKKVKSLAVLDAPTKLTAGETDDLRARITPAGATGAAVRWKSSKPGVLGVDAAGRLTAKKQGSATLTLTAGAGKAQCKVQVVAPVRQVRLAQKSLSLVVGKSASLPVAATTTDGSKARLAWKSTNPAVATVNSKGKVRAVAPGSAKITVKAENGKRAVLKVQVRQQAKALKKVGIRGLPQAMAVGQSANLTARLSPAAATGAVVRWKSSDSRVLAVDAAGTATAMAPGQAVVTVRAGGKLARLTVVVQG